MCALGARKVSQSLLRQYGLVMIKGKNLTKTEIRKRLLAEWETTITEGFGISSDETRKIVNAMLVAKPDPAITSVDDQNLKAAFALTYGNTIRNRIYRTKIETQEQLDAAIQEIREAKHLLPTATRKAFKTVMKTLPRRGGPGRQPKLSPQQASQACDQIATFIRQKHKLKEALKKTSDLSLGLFGKKIGPRTLQKAWDRRDQLIGE